MDREGKFYVLCFTSKTLFFFITMDAWMHQDPQTRKFEFLHTLCFLETSMNKHNYSSNFTYKTIKYCLHILCTAMKMFVTGYRNLTYTSSSMCNIWSLTSSAREVGGWVGV